MNEKELTQQYPWANTNQIREIKLGLENKVDILKYTNLNYTCDQMERIRMGLEKGLDVSQYARPDISWQLMRKIYYYLLENKQ